MRWFATQKYGDVFYLTTEAIGNPKERGAEVLLGLNNDIELLKHFINSILKN